MTAPVYQSFSEAKLATAGTALTINKPSGTTEGDLLIAVVTFYGYQFLDFISTPSGWTNIYSGTYGTFPTIRLAYKIAGSSEPADYTFERSLNSQAYGFIIRISNGFYSGGAVSRNVSTTPTCPSITTTVDDCMLLRIFGADDDSVYAFPGSNSSLPIGHTGITIDESSSSGSTCSGGAAYTIQPTAGVVAAANFSLTASEHWWAFTINISPNYAPTPDPMTFSSTPAGVSSSSITMTASEATHPTEDVEYYFTCTAGGGADSGWQADRTYAPSGLTADTQYTYTVKARSVTSQDETAESSGASAYTYPSAPAAPTSVAATRASSSQINLSWTKASGATGYDIYRKTGSGGSWGLLISLGDVASYNNSGLSSNTTYYYKIKSKKTGASSGLTSYSDYSTPDAGATTTAAPTPNPATFSSAPAPVSSTSVTMTATTASHPLESVEYLFTCTTDGSKSSSWQANPTYTPNTLSPSIQYTFTVKTRTAVSQIEGTASSGAAAYTYPTTPDVPTDLTPSVISNVRIDLSWTKSSGATGYQIYRKVGAGAYSLFDTVGDVAAYENSGLTPGVTYYYKLKALTTYAPSSLTSYSDYCDEVSAATTTIPSPDPMTFSSAPTAVDSDEITMTASLATAPDSVEYQFDCDDDSFDSAWQASREYQPSGLDSDTQYGFKVKARNSVTLEETAQSSYAYAYTYPAVPDVVSDLAVDEYDNSHIVLTWAEIAEATGYQIYRKEANDTEFALLDTVEEVDNYDDTTVLPGGTYSYKIKTITLSASSGLTSYSNYSNTVTQALPPSPDPMTVEEASIVTSSSITISATTAESVNTPEYYFECIDSDVEASSWITNKFYNFSGLDSDTLYGFRIKARDSLSLIETDWSEVFYFYTLPSSPTTPSNLIVYPATSPLKNELVWIASESADGYEIYRSTDQDIYTLINTTNETTYDDTDIIADIIYYYKIRAYNNSEYQSDIGVYSDYSEVASNTAETQPIANAGEDIEIAYSDRTSIQLNAEASSSPVGIITDYIWYENGQIIALGATPIIELSPGQHKLSLQVINNYSFSFDTIYVTVAGKPISLTNYLPRFFE